MTDGTDGDELARRLDEAWDSTDEAPRPSDFDGDEIDVPAVFATFGSWEAALEAADLPTPSGRRTTADEYIDAVRELADDLGRPPTSDEMEADGRYSYTVGWKLFGGWEEVMEAAGLDPEPNYRISSEDYLADIHRVSGEVGGVPTMEEMKEHGEYSPSVGVDRFGSWPLTLDEAGFDVDESRRQNAVTDEEYLDEIRRLADEFDRAPTPAEMNDHGEYSVTTGHNRFGSWAKAVKEAGLDPVRGEKEIANPDIDDEEYLDEIRRVADEIGRPPSTIEMAEYGEYSSTTGLRKFGSWCNALNEAGFDVDSSREDVDRSRIDPEEYLLEVEQLTDELGRPPKTKEMNERSSFSASYGANRWGSWAKTLIEAGVEPAEQQLLSAVHDSSDASMEELVEDLRRVRERVGRRPTTADVYQYGLYAAIEYVNRYDTDWEGVLDEVFGES